MGGPLSRRELLSNIACASTGALLGARLVPTQTSAILIAGRPVEITVVPVSSLTVRISFVPLESSRPKTIPEDGSLVQQKSMLRPVRLRFVSSQETLRFDTLTVSIVRAPLSLT